MRRVAPMVTLVAALAAALALAPAVSAAPAADEFVVELAGPPAAARTPAARATTIRELAAQQRAVASRILATVPGARVRWRYRLVLNGLAVVAPAGASATLAAVEGVARVTPSVRYRSRLDRGPIVIDAPVLWGASLGNAGQGVKIAIVDDGIDQRTPLLAPHGLEAPAGFPRGNLAYTTGKVIVARSFPSAFQPRGVARLPFDRRESFHGTHVAGIAAGSSGVVAPAAAGQPALTLSGVAPAAYLGNYRALTVPTDSGVGLDGNSPEILAAIEAAVADGMDVINLSIGEPEVGPGRDLVALALDNAAALGVVPVVAAGNEHDTSGRGSVASPGSSAGAITVAAVTSDRTFGVAGTIGAPGGARAGLEQIGLLGVSLGAFDRDAPAGPLVVAPAGVDPALCSGPAEARVEGILLAAPGGCGPGAKARTARALGASALVVVPGRPGDAAAFLRTSLPVLVASTDVATTLLAAVQAEPTGWTLEVGAEPAAVLTGGAGVIASFSSGGPTPLGLLLKPDVSAPGVDVLSALPVGRGRFAFLSGTSMAAPHVAGAVALLRQAHPDWTVEQIRSALVLTGRPVWADARARAEAPATRQGGGLIDLAGAASPLVVAVPSSLSFGLLDARDGPLAPQATIALSDAGGGAGTWAVRVVDQRPGGGATVVAPATVDVPGPLIVSAAVDADAAEGDHEGWLVLERDGVARRIPFWLRVTRPALPRARAVVVRSTRTIASTTAGQPARVARYRYPEAPTQPALRGPERVFVVPVARPVANVGAAVVGQAPGVDVVPLVLLAQDENRLAGPTGLPVVTNPYLTTFGMPWPVAAALRPATGRLAIVVDSRSRREAGRFRLRIWVDDVTPPSVRVDRVLGVDGELRARATDGGAGVDPDGIRFRVDGGDLLIGAWDGARGEAVLPIGPLPAGRHRLELRVSDRQEAKNSENSGPILRNTAIVRTTFVVRPR